MGAAEPDSAVPVAKLIATTGTPDVGWVNVEEMGTVMPSATASAWKLQDDSPPEMEQVMSTELTPAAGAAAFRLAPVGLNARVAKKQV